MTGKQAPDAPFAVEDAPADWRSARPLDCNGVKIPPAPPSPLEPVPPTPPKPPLGRLGVEPVPVEPPKPPLGRPGKGLVLEEPPLGRPGNEPVPVEPSRRLNTTLLASHVGGEIPPVLPPKPPGRLPKPGEAAIGALATVAA